MTLMTGLLTALFLACSLAAVGDLVVGRMSENWFSANQSFILGATLVAALFFPSSFLLGRNALAAVFSGLCAAGAFWILMQLRRVPRLARTARQWQRPNVVEIAAVLAILTCALYFFAQTLANSFGSDGLHIWARRAIMLFHAGTLTTEPWPGAGYDLRILDYPPMIPLLEALSARFQGYFDFQNCKPIFCLFYCSLLVSLYSSARSLAGRTAALMMTAAIALLPGVTAEHDWIGFADLPMACVVAAIVAAAARRGPDSWSFRDPLPWLTAGLLTVKSEGTILFSLTLASGAFALLITRRFDARFARGLWKSALILLGGLALRLAYVRWTGIADPTYGPLDRVHLSRAIFLWADIPAVCLPKLLDLSTWGLLWIALIPSVVIVAWKGSALQRSLAVGALGALACYTAIFYFTNWEFVEHIDKSYARLLAHIVPAASMVILSAWKLLGGGRGVEARLDRG